VAGKRVPVLAPDPKTGRLRFATVDESEADVVVQGGGKLLTKGEADAQEAEIRQQERADKAGIAGTAQTVIGAVGGALNPLMYSGGPGSTGEAVNRGVTSGLTAGLNEVAERKAYDAFGPAGSGAKFAQQRDDITAASPTAHTVGEVMGFTAGAAALPASPAGVIGKAGGLAERGLGLALKGGGGALKQAATTGAKMALRGGVEAGIAGAVQSGADDLVHDREINGEKMWTMAKHSVGAGAVLGGGLGFGGSIAASGVKAAGRSVIRGLTRTAEDGPGGKVGALFGDADGAAVRAANEQAWKAAGGGFGLQSTRYAKQAAKYFPNGTADVGEVAIRYGVLDVPHGMTPTQAALHAAKTGTPAEMLPRAEGALDRVGKQIGDITEASGARIQAPQVMKAIDEVAGRYEATAATRPMGRSIRAFGNELLDSLGLRSLDSSAPVQSVLRERKAIDRIAFQDAPTVDPKVMLEAKRSLRGALEDVIAESMDAASGKVPGHLRGSYEGLKRDYHKLSVLTEALEDSAARQAKAATLGLGEKFAVAQAVATGHMLAAPVLGMGGKVLRERGNAAAAAFLTRAAEQQTFSKLLKKAEALVDSAVTGSIAEAPSTPRKLPAGKRTSKDIADGRAEHEATRAEAQAIVKWSADAAASPQTTLARLQETAAAIGRHAGPRAAAAYSTSSIKAMQFVASYVPVRDRRDPLDPRSVPPLTMDESQALVRAHRYATEPRTVWEDFAKGIVTPEGLDAAQTLMPEQFAEFQYKLFAHVQDLMLKNRQLSQGQRLRIDKLLGGAAIRPEDIARSQQDFQDLPSDPEQGPKPTGNKPVDMPIQQSGFDQVEMRKAQ
jgi:hypothetical protein